jgi:hypothetical protein
MDRNAQLARIARAREHDALVSSLAERVCSHYTEMSGFWVSRSFDPNGVEYQKSRANWRFALDCLIGIAMGDIFSVLEIPQQAVDQLRDEPSLADAFDQRYRRPGLAKKILRLSIEQLSLAWRSQQRN